MDINKKLEKDLTLEPSKEKEIAVIKWLFKANTYFKLSLKPYDEIRITENIKDDEPAFVGHRKISLVTEFEAEIEDLHEELNETKEQREIAHKELETLVKEHNELNKRFNEQVSHNEKLTQDNNDMFKDIIQLKLKNNIELVDNERQWISRNI